MVRTQLIPTLTPEQYKRQQHRATSPHADLWALLDKVTDPEIPVLSIWDIGILTDIQRIGQRVVVTITPTYSGCPAVETIREDIAAVLSAHHVRHFDIVTQLAPAWTSDWLTVEGRRKLHQYGIAPPACNADGADLAVQVTCPQCDSTNTEQVSAFSSTACKSMFRCQDCLEYFDYFKPI